MKKGFLITLIGTFNIISIYAQRITIGQACPDVVMNQLINYSTATARLSDFHGKLVILDFWNPGCVGCIKAFPKMDSLQKQFGNKIQVLIVGKESKDSVSRYFAEHKNIWVPPLPFVTGDTILSKLFPHRLVPHHIWIDGNGIVQEITGGWNTSAKNIQAVLDGKNVHLAVKKDVLDYYDWEKPLISIDDKSLQENVKFYSCLMPGIVGLSGTFAVRGTPVNRIYLNRMPAIRLYSTAYGERGKYDFSSRSSVILEVKDTLKYTFPNDDDIEDEWEAENTYAYDLMVPPSKANQLYKIMQQDLSRYFDVTATVEKRKIKCLVLSRSSSKDKMHTKGGAPGNNFYKRLSDSDTTFRYLKNQPFQMFVSRLSACLEPGVMGFYTPPFVDATAYTGAVDMEIKAKAFDNIVWKKDLTAIRQELRKYDLDLKEEFHLQSVLVIRENDPKGK